MPTEIRTSASTSQIASAIKDPDTLQSRHTGTSENLQSTQESQRLSDQMEQARTRLASIRDEFRHAFRQTEQNALSRYEQLERTQHPGLELAREIEQIVPVELTQTGEETGLYRFNDPDICFLARTLTQRTSSNTSTPASAASAAGTPAISRLTEREFLTLTNKLSQKFSILITPATLIQPHTPINLISAKKGRPEWYGLPSLLYAVPHSRGGHTRLDPHPDGPELSRSSGSHPLSFASNQAFGKTDEEKKAFKHYRQTHTPHQSLTKLIENAQAMKLFKDPTPPSHDLKQFKDSLGNWVRQDIQSAGKARSDHNEVGIRLWPWDVTHVLQAELPEGVSGAEAEELPGQKLEQALHAAIVMATKRHELAAELLENGKGRGIDHPLLTEFLEHQISAEIPPDASDHAGIVKDRLAQCSVETRQALALDLASKLLEKVSVVGYTPGQPGFTPIEDIDRLMTLEVYQSCRKLAEEMNNASTHQTSLKLIGDCVHDMIDDTVQRLKLAIDQPLQWPGVHMLTTAEQPTAGPYDLRDERYLQLARALIDGQHASQAPWSDHHAHLQRASRLTQQEMSTLTNNLTRAGEAVDILVTPGTLLKPGIPIHTMSTPYTSKLERWAGNPIVIYATPVYPDADRTAGTGAPGNTGSLQTPPEHRRFSGHVRSVKSNEAFTPEFNAGRATRSRAEDLDALTDTIAANAEFHLKDKSRPISRGGFETSHQIAQWAGQQALSGTGTSAEGIAHNEVLTRLWPWDITQVCVGHHPDNCSSEERQGRLLEALSTANSLAVSRLQLATQLCETGPGKGLEHPVFLDYLSHQLAQDQQWTQDLTGNPDALSAAAAYEQAATMKTEARYVLLEKIVAQLTRSVLVSEYAPGQNTFQPVKQDAVLDQAAIQALNQQLTSQLENVSNANSSGPR